MEIDRNFAIVHLNHIYHNYRLIKSLVKGCEVMAVVKADAYGHGSVEVAKYLESQGVKYFAVACMKEAIELRDGGLRGEILIFGRTCPENIFYLKKYNLIQTVHSLEYAKQIASYRLPVRVHLNIDTGMSRFGFYLHQTENLDTVFNEVLEISRIPELKLEGIYTHFANSDEPESNFYLEQFKLFQSLLKKLEEAGLKGLLKHAANSAASLAYPETYLDMVRVGIAMYGYPPVKTDMDFKPGMEVFARVSSVRQVKATDTVSYGRTYSPKTEEKIATLSIGYADGYNRRLSNQDLVYYQGHILPVIGRVCMDAIMISTEGQNVGEGDLVEVFGENKDMRTMCQTLETIPYEILCAVSKRVTRIYKK